MMKCVFLVATLVAYGTASSEFAYGIKTTRAILNLYNQQLAAGSEDFRTMIRIVFNQLEGKAYAINETVGQCIHDSALPLEESLNQEVEQVMDAEIAKIDQLLDSVDNLNAEELEELWTAVSSEGKIRNEMNAAIMRLKKDVSKKMSDFRAAIPTMCGFK